MIDGLALMIWTGVVIRQVGIHLAGIPAHVHSGPGFGSLRLTTLGHSVLNLGSFKNQGGADFGFRKPVTEAGKTFSTAISASLARRDRLNRCAQECRRCSGGSLFEVRFHCDRNSPRMDCSPANRRPCLCRVGNLMRTAGCPRD